MGTHPIFESDFDCLTEMADVDAPPPVEEPVVVEEEVVKVPIPLQYQAIAYCALLTMALVAPIRIAKSDSRTLPMEMSSTKLRSSRPKKRPSSQSWPVLRCFQSICSTSMSPTRCTISSRATSSCLALPLLLLFSSHWSHQS